MKWRRGRARQRSTSPKPIEKTDQQAREKLEEAREEEARQYRQKHYGDGVRNANCDSTTANRSGRHLTNAHTNHRRDHLPKTKSPNRSALKHDSAAGKERRDRRRRASVGFCEQLEVKDIIPAKELVDNRKQLWWQQNEYKQMVELSCAIVDLARLDKNTETRGLEDLMKNDQTDTLKTRVDVLMAQRILRQRHIQDDEALGGLYHTSTAKYLQEAALRARQDEQEARKYLADTRRACRRMSV